MDYAIARDRPVPDEIQRIMHEEIRGANEKLMDSSVPRDKRIHDARKCFKQIRAVLRLVRDPLDRSFGEENVWYRDAGRDLGTVRDATAVLESLEKLTKHATLSAAVVRRARLRLEARRAAITNQLLARRIRNVRARLAPASDRIVRWPRLPDSFEAIAGGLARTYRDGRRAMKAARTTRNAEAFHEWRKRVKDHWYHAQLLQHIWPDVMKAYAAELESLSKALGDHHDLVLLRGIVARQYKLVAVIDARLHKLESRSMDIGARVFAEPARPWLKRMRSYWSVWRPE